MPSFAARLTPNVRALVVRALVVQVLSLLVVVVLAAPPARTVVMAARSCFVPPVDAPVTDPFRMPPCPFCPGNRGIEYGPVPGQPVRALAAGTVDFAGSVAGTRWLVVTHADGLRASYGRLASISLSRDDVVRAGQVVGTSSDELYVGLRDGDRPVDPTPSIGRWRHRHRLVPIDGSPARPAGPPRLVCPIAGGGR